MIPSRGAFSDMSRMTEPHRMGGVMWDREKETQMMAPLDLHGLSLNDLNNLNRIFIQLRTYRKITPALQIVNDVHWDQMPLIKPYLMATMAPRSEAREMKRTDDWDAFWQAFD